MQTPSDRQIVSESAFKAVKTLPGKKNAKLVSYPIYSVTSRQEDCQKVSFLDSSDTSGEVESK